MFFSKGWICSDAILVSPFFNSKVLSQGSAGRRLGQHWNVTGYAESALRWGDNVVDLEVILAVSHD
jgi:hypothetical protein